MSQLSAIILENSALRILRALYFSNTGLGLRELSDLSQLSLGATQDNTKKLVRDGLIKREKSIGKLSFSLNLRADDHLLLSQLVELEQKSILEKRAQNTSTKKLIAILETAEELQKVKAKHAATR